MRACAIVVVVGAALLSACSNTVTTMGVSYNEGLAESFNSLILTNIVRSVKGYPTYYSAVGDFSGVDTNTTATLPEVVVTLNSLSTAELDLQPTITKERQSSVSVSSLETQDFTTSMHARVDPTIFETLIESRDQVHLNLALALLVEKIAVPETEYAFVLNSVTAICSQRLAYLSGPQRGLCKGGIADLGTQACADRRRVTVGGRSEAVVVLTNDPTNACLYNSFRVFIEALALNEPHIHILDDGRTSIALAQLPDSPTLFRSSSPA